MNIKIIGATVVTGDGTDLVILKTSLASPLPKVTAQLLMLEFKAEYRTGADYMRKNFGIEPEIIDTRRN